MVKKSQRRSKRSKRGGMLPAPRQLVPKVQVTKTQRYAVGNNANFYGVLTQGELHNIFFMCSGTTQGWPLFSSVRLRSIRAWAFGNPSFNANTLQLTLIQHSEKSVADTSYNPTVMAYVALRIPQAIDAYYVDYDAAINDADLVQFKCTNGQFIFDLTVDICLQNNVLQGPPLVVVSGTTGIVYAGTMLNGAAVPQAFPTL